jgi:transposase
MFLPTSTVVLAIEPVDLRRGHDGLAMLVQTLWKADPYSGTCFVFFGRTRNRIKVLFYTRGGLVVYYKRLESGRFVIPKPKLGDNQIALDASQLAMLLDGVDLRSAQRIAVWKPGVKKVAIGDRQLRYDVINAIG